MNKDLDELLDNLKPEINKKCFEIKQRRKQRMQSIKLVILCLLFMIVPNIFLMFNIKIIYIVVIALIFGLLKLFVKLPDILKRCLEANCYE